MMIEKIRKIVNEAKYFIKNQADSKVFAKTYDMAHGILGWYIEVNYDNKIGFYWDLSPCFISIGVVAGMSGYLTADKADAINSLGKCPKCGEMLLSHFSGIIHNIDDCDKARPALIENVTA